ncbi:MAG: OmpA family protein [Rubrivivax sp.]|nr:OmpA family protein [Rubrivivax sp.]
MPTLALLFVVALAVCACTTVAPPEATAPAPAPTPAQQQTALAAALGIEQRWLNSWFRGTPVLIAQRDDGALVIEVPREFCFDPGRSSVKPALAAVLDKVAESLRRRPMAHLTALAAPGDRTANTPLALQRATQVHGYLRRRGVPETRLGAPAAATAAVVQLRIGAAPRLD